MDIMLLRLHGNLFGWWWGVDLRNHWLRQPGVQQHIAASPLRLLIGCIGLVPAAKEHSIGIFYFCIIPRGICVLYQPGAKSFSLGYLFCLLLGILCSFAGAVSPFSYHCIARVIW